MNHQERLDKINKAGLSLWESIDRPIRPLVKELHRFGLRTRFSCCGFNYDGEEEPKSHASNPFIQIWAEIKSLEYDAREAILGLTEFVTKLPNYGRLWSMRDIGGKVFGLDFNNPTKNNTYWQNKDPGCDLAIHDYEYPLLAFNELMFAFKQQPDGWLGLRRVHEIIDGNASYSITEFLKEEWQIKPKDAYGISY